MTFQFRSLGIGLIFMLATSQFAISSPGNKALQQEEKAVAHRLAAERSAAQKSAHLAASHAASAHKAVVATQLRHYADGTGKVGTVDAIIAGIEHVGLSAKANAHAEASALHQTAHELSEDAAEKNQLAAKTSRYFRPKLREHRDRESEVSSARADAAVARANAQSEAVRATFPEDESVPQN